MTGITTCLLFTIIYLYGKAYHGGVNVSKFLDGQLRLIMVSVCCVEGSAKIPHIGVDMDIFVY